jgi:hypothetical protein
MTQENGNGITFQTSARITNKELWRELQQLRTEVAVLGTQYQHTASEVEKIKKQQDEFLRVANENLLEHERILSSLQAIGVKIGFWAVVSGAAVSLIWNILVSPLLKP